MKQVYPQVRPRRLGTRGNSRYCYAGLKKRLKLEEPSTPECGGGKPLKVCADIEQELNEATSLLIREWAEKLLTVKFSSLRDLALYLIDKMFVDHQSSAAHTVLSTMAKSREGEMIYYVNIVFMMHDILITTTVPQQCSVQKKLLNYNLKVKPRPEIITVG